MGPQAQIPWSLYFLYGYIYIYISLYIYTHVLYHVHGPQCPGLWAFAPPLFVNIHTHLFFTMSSTSPDDIIRVDTHGDVGCSQCTLALYPIFKCLGPLHVIMQIWMKFRYEIWGIIDIATMLEPYDGTGVCEKNARNKKWLWYHVVLPPIPLIQSWGQGEEVFAKSGVYFARRCTALPDPSTLNMGIWVEWDQHCWI